MYGISAGDPYPPDCSFYRVRLFYRSEDLKWDRVGALQFQHWHPPTNRSILSRYNFRKGHHQRRSVLRRLSLHEKRRPGERVRVSPSINPGQI